MTSSVLLTGSSGFIGSNLLLHLREKGVLVHKVPRGTDPTELNRLISNADVLIHLAGTNRPSSTDEFAVDNVEFTRLLLETVTSIRPMPVVFSSSTQAALDNPYGLSKREAENLVRQYGEANGQPVAVVRLPNVFGKWCKPNYNSVVATFAHNVSRGIPLRVDDPGKVVELAYIDDVVSLLAGALDGTIFVDQPRPDVLYRVTLGRLAEMITEMHLGRSENRVAEVGSGFMRCLYSTYVSYLDPTGFSYPLRPNIDPRGTFTEVVRTPTSGQFSYLTAVPGATRGAHYHHSKIEKFVVVSGQARFRFRCLLDGQMHEVHSDSREPFVIESIPGWVHDITNIGQEELVVMVWANEVFDSSKPDTHSQEVVLAEA